MVRNGPGMATYEQSCPEIEAARVSARVVMVMSSASTEMRFAEVELRDYSWDIRNESIPTRTQ